MNKKHALILKKDEKVIQEPTTTTTNPCRTKNSIISNRKSLPDIKSNVDIV